MASYLGQVDVFRAIVPQPQPENGSEFPQQPVLNFIDELVDAKLTEAEYPSGRICVRTRTFCGEAYLDIIGTLPTAAESRKFLADASAD